MYHLMSPYSYVWLVDKQLKLSKFSQEIEGDKYIDENKDK